MVHNVTDGDDVSAFATSHLRVTKGVRAGQRLVLTDWQSWLMRQLFERSPEDGRLRYSRALIGLPRKNGKSLLGSLIALYGLLVGEPGAEVYSAAGDKKQARIVFNEAKAMVLASPSLAQHCRVYKDAIEVPSEGAVYRVLSADAKLQQGLNPSTVVFDELHVQRDAELWDALTLGSGARIEPIVVAITTAGWDLESLCGQLYTQGCSLSAGTAEEPDPTFGFWWWEAPADCARGDRDAWRVANPNMAEGLMNERDMRTAATSPTTRESAFRRYRLNQWVRVEESWLPAGTWEACEADLELNEAVEFDEDLPVYVAIDMAHKRDSVAVVMAQPQPDPDDPAAPPRLVVFARIWLPSTTTYDVAAVENYLRQLHLDWAVAEFAYDPAYFTRSAQALEDEGLPMVEFPQSPQRMVPACQTAYEVICSGQLLHDGDPVFTDQVLSAATRETDAGWRLSKGKSKRKIDAAVALVMALDRALARTEDGTLVPMASWTD